MKAKDFEHLYTLEPGDKWAWIGDEVVISNPEKIPFTVNLKTGEIKNEAFFPIEEARAAAGLIEKP